jgi:LacI family transcriptional regulator
MPVVPESGRPLYASVRDSLRAAIDNGVFTPGEQMPSTKELSEQMSVSLVTAHRALQELVSIGVLQRSQGKGTFIHDRYPMRKSQMTESRVGLLIHREASLADYYHGQVLEGVRRESDRLNVDLILLRFGEDVRNECNGFLYLNPLPEELADIESRNRRQATVVIGARGTNSRIGSVDVDNVDLGRQAVDHLANLGHRKIMLVGGIDQNSNSRDRRAGFLAACDEHRISVPDPWRFGVAGWRLGGAEPARLTELLKSPDRPTAVFAAGYYFALDVYNAAQQAGLNVPNDLSIVGVDDPPSAEYLSPPLTTLRQPLVNLGEMAVSTLLELIRRDDLQPGSRTLRAELVVRGSTARPA